MCSACLVCHPTPTGRNWPFVHKKKQCGEGTGISTEELTQSPISRVDRLLSGIHIGEELFDGEDMKGDERVAGNYGTNAALLDIVRLQQEQMRALHVSIENMNGNMSSLAKKVSKAKKSSKALHPEGFSDSTGTSSGSDSEDLDRHPSLASPAVGVPEFKSESKRHKFSLEAYLPKTVSNR